jgi:hypothetical protein
MCIAPFLYLHLDCRYCILRFLGEDMFISESQECC